jgi:hypothetical protein
MNRMYEIFDSTSKAGMIRVRVTETQSTEALFGIPAKAKVGVTEPFKPTVGKQELLAKLGKEIHLGCVGKPLANGNYAVEEVTAPEEVPATV